MMKQEIMTTIPTSTHGFPCSSNCHHMFSLKPLRVGLYFHEQVSLLCCPHSTKKNGSLENIWPQPYFDDKVYFPIFMLAIDRESTIKREKEYFQNHQNRIKNLEMSQPQILVPHPGKSKVTCFVCKSHYTDYRKHIQTKKHRKNLNSSKMEPSIRQLIKTVSESQQQLKEQVSTTCNQQFSRMVSFQSNNQPSRRHIKPTKKHLKQTKLNLKEAERMHALSFDAAKLDQLEGVQIKLQGFGNEGEDYRTSINNLIHQFRISDYLV